MKQKKETILINIKGQIMLPFKRQSMEFFKSFEYFEKRIKTQYVNYVYEIQKAFINKLDLKEILKSIEKLEQLSLEKDLKEIDFIETNFYKKEMKNLLEETLFQLDYWEKEQIKQKIDKKDLEEYFLDKKTEMIIEYNTKYQPKGFYLKLKQEESSKLQLDYNFNIDFTLKIQTKKGLSKDVAIVILAVIKRFFKLIRSSVKDNVNKNIIAYFKAMENHSKETKKEKQIAYSDEIINRFFERNYLTGISKDIITMLINKKQICQHKENEKPLKIFQQNLIKNDAQIIKKYIKYKNWILQEI